MRKRDASDVLLSAIAVGMDAAAILGGFMLATWIKFRSELIAVPKGEPDNLWQMYLIGASFATLLHLIVFRALGLFVRPQTGSFPNKIPRLIRAVGIGTVLTAALAFAVKTTPPFSTHVVALSIVTNAFFVLLERYILFRIEWNLARHSRKRNCVLILGTDEVAARLKRTLSREPMLRSRIVGFLRTDLSQPDSGVAPEEIKGTVEDLPSFLAANEVDQLILASSDLPRERLLDIVVLCEQNLITFNVVPDLFRVLTSNMDVQSLDDIPLLGVRVWPLDLFWNRVVKRGEDIAGALFGLVATAPVIAIAAVVIKQTSPGPVFFRQERCGEGGRPFMLYKLRTMQVGAEETTGPVFADRDDPRTTRIGGWLRRQNIDELPQLWNVLKGDMSLVGPRPERPHFVEQFKEDFMRYMSRHVSKPGLTGWAQVNGLRGRTSIEERLKYDLYYLENWSLAFDFKILLKTFFARENAY